MRLMRAGLGLREERPALFAEGAYLPLEVEGEAARHLLAFAREGDGEAAIAAAPRLALGLLDESDRPLVPPERWGGTAIVLPERLRALAFRDAVTGDRVKPGERILVRDLLARFPVALAASDA